MTARANLHDEFDERAYDHALLCTFNFQTDFFEEYCLEQLSALVPNENVTVIMDGREYDLALHGPISGWPRKANLRYLLHPVRPRGRFHPKLYLLASAQRGVLIVGSANLTRPGFTRNAEMAGVYRYHSGKDEGSLPLFRSAFEFILRVEQLSPSRELQSRLSLLAETAPWLVPAGSPGPSTPCRLIHNVDQPLLPQILAGVSSPVDRVVVLSPFFDEQPGPLDWLVQRLAPRAITIYTQNGRTTLTDAWAEHPAMQRKGSQLLFGAWHDDEHAQDLHAKALAIVQGDRVLLAYGSANFTRAGLLSTPTTGNVESLVVFDTLRLRQCNPDRLFDPDSTARPDQLRSSGRASPPPAPTAGLVLREASLEDARLRCELADSEVESPRAVLTFGDGASAQIPLTHSSGGWDGRATDDTSRRAARAATVVHVEAEVDGSLRLSNRVLLLNLQEGEAGRGSGRDRRVREAQQSAERFAAVLDDLLRAPDRSALLSFLTYCDIPLVGAPRLFGSSRERAPAEQVRAELRAIGTQNLRAYADLHEAAVAFCERHISRLARHVRCVSIDAVPSCMHLARSVSRVLARQVEQLLVGLECTTSLDNDEWYAHRQRLDAYLSLYLDLLKTVQAEWIPALLEAYRPAVVREAIRLDLKPLSEFIAGFLDVRRRIEHYRTGSLRVRTPLGALVEPPVSQDNILWVSTWNRWSAHVDDHGNELRKLA